MTGTAKAQARHRTVSVDVGGVTVGGGAPIVVQSMTNTDTADVEGTARQSAELAAAGSEIVRISRGQLPMRRASSPSPALPRGEGRGEGQPQTPEQASAPHPDPLPMLKKHGERGQPRISPCAG